MKKKTVFWLTAAVLLILIGGMLFGGAMMALQWDFGKLSTETYETNVHEIHDAFHGVSAKTDTAAIEFLPSEDGKVKVVCYEEEKCRHTVSVQDGVLTVHRVDERKWYERIGLHFGSPKVTVYLPQDTGVWLEVQASTGKVTLPTGFRLQSVDITVTTGNVTMSSSTLGITKIKTSTGSIRVEQASVGELDLTVSTGKVTVTETTCESNLTVKVSTGKTSLTNVTCEDLTSHGSTGSITLTNVIASGRLSIERSTGNVTFDRADAAELVVDTDTGDVKGSLLTDKIFFAKSDTGRVIVPETTVGGRCEIETDTGDIKITVEKDNT